MHTPFLFHKARPAGHALAVVLAAVVAVPDAAAGAGSAFLVFDNDTFSGRDEHYTNGVQFGWLSEPLDAFYQGPLFDVVARHAARLPGLASDERVKFVGLNVSHRMFTPQDLSTCDPVPNDVPYSAEFYGTLTVSAQDEDTLNAYGLSLGLAGPGAGGEDLQRCVHDLIDAVEPMGWDNQIGNEPLLNLAFEHRRRLVAFGRRDSWGGDVLGQAGAAVGNFLTMATVGISARFGWSVPDDFAMPAAYFGDESIGRRATSVEASTRSVWLYAGINATHVAHAIFWDGNMFRDSPSIDYDPFVARLQFGLHVHQGRFGASVGMTFTTIPWDDPEGRRSESYGTVTLSYRL